MCNYDSGCECRELMETPDGILMHAMYTVQVGWDSNILLETPHYREAHDIAHKLSAAYFDIIGHCPHMVISHSWIPA